MMEFDEAKFRLVQLSNETGHHGLIIPEKGHTSAWDSWDDRWLRSYHFDMDTGKNISNGFPKFMNLNEGNGEYKITLDDLESAIKKSRVILTDKLDGSLLIRYVHNGNVYWRTRGGLTVGMDNSDELQTFFDDNPRLLDPSLYSDCSLLFEWVSPKNQIVIKYHDPALVLIGVIHNGNPPELMSWNRTIEVASGVGATVPAYFEIVTPSTLHDLVLFVQKNRDIEGVVLRIQDNQFGVRLVKIKSDHYKALHALRSNLTSARLVDLWIEWGKPTYDEYEERFVSTFDYECFEYARPAMSSMFDGVGEAIKCYNHIRNFVETNAELSQKEFALRVHQAYSEGTEKASACFTLRKGQGDVADKFWKKIILQNSKQYNMSMFSNSIGVEE